MMTGRNRFNINLLLLVAALVAGGCQTGSDREKQITTLRVHVEVVSDSPTFSTAVRVSREKPVELTVNRSPFLTEDQVDSAKLVDVRGGYDLEIKFNRHGSWLLETYTTANVGKHLAIFCEFGEKHFRQDRWLGAPRIEKRLSKGVLVFTPDASRDEVEEIVLGLNNAGKKNEEDSKW
jgi:preprotein translocase subunit SecD